MITRHELKELASFKVEDVNFVNLFLNVDPTENPKDEWLVHFKNMARDTINNLKPHQKKEVQKDIELIEKYLSDRPEGMKRGIAIISCREKGFWRTYNTAIPFLNKMIVDSDPFIKPLAAMIDLYQRYLVVVVDNTRAKVLITSVGEIEEVNDISSDIDNSNAGKDGSKSDFGSHRAADKQRDKVQRNVYKGTLKVIEVVQAEEGIKRILLGGTDRARANFKEALSLPLREKIVGEFVVEAKSNNSDILERLMPVMKDVEYKFERKALDSLFDQNKSTALGLSDVLTALQQGNVHKMYVLSHVTTPGSSCTQCGALTPERDRPCPYCGSAMRHISYMLDHAIQRAIDQGARVDMLDDAPRLEKVGGIGAVLRY